MTAPIQKNSDHLANVLPFAAIAASLRLASPKTWLWTFCMVITPSVINVNFK